MQKLLRVIESSLMGSYNFMLYRNVLLHILTFLTQMCASKIEHAVFDFHKQIPAEEAQCFNLQ